MLNLLHWLLLGFKHLSELSILVRPRIKSLLYPRIIHLGAQQVFPGIYAMQLQRNALRNIRTRSDKRMPSAVGKSLLSLRHP